jgi:cell shape-determining protein MreC
VLTGLVFLSLLLIFFPGLARPMSQLVQVVLRPLGAGTTYLTSHVRSRAQELLGSGQPAGDDVEPLLLALQQTIASQQEQIDRLRGWRSAGGMENFPCKLIGARVVANDALPSREYRLIGAGKAEGVQPGGIATTCRLLHDYNVALPKNLAVLGRNYVVGWIVEAYAHTATLQLVTDRRFEMQASLWRMVRPGQKRELQVEQGGKPVAKTFTHNGQSASAHPIAEPIRVQAQGDGQEILLRHVKAIHGIAEGDVLTTSPATPWVPCPVKIGTVVRTEPEPKEPHFVTVHVKPMADLSSLQELYIVLPIEGKR